MDTSGPLALPRTEVDELAASIPEPSFFEPTYPSASASGAPTFKAPTATFNQPTRMDAMEGFEDEDMELQAALQASLAGPEQHFLPGGALGPTATSTSSARATTLGRLIPEEGFANPRTGSIGFPPPVIPTTHRYGLSHEDEDEDIAEEDEDEEEEDEDEDEDDEMVLPAVASARLQAQVPAQPLDPVQASIERNRVIMERMRREQEAALRFNYDVEAQRIESAWRGGAPGGASSGRGFPVVEDDDADANAGEQDEDELIRRAIAESMAMARSHHGENVNVGMDEDEEDDGDYVPPQTARQGIV